MPQAHPISQDGVHMLVPSCPHIQEQISYQLHRKWLFQRVPVVSFRRATADVPAVDDPATLQGWNFEGASISRLLQPVRINPELSTPERYTDEEYAQLQPSEWSRAETDAIFDLVEAYDTRWIVIHDRFSHQNRSLVDLKKRYYEVLEGVQQLRGIKCDHYDPQLDLMRRARLKELSDDHFLVAELQELQLNIAVMESTRDQAWRDYVSDGLAMLTLTQIVGEQRKKKKKRNKDVPDLKRRRGANPLAPIGEDSDADIFRQNTVKKEKKVTGGITLRSQTLPPFKSIVTQQKIDSIMQELGILTVPLMPTVSICQAYDELHKNILQLIDIRRNLDKLDGPSRERSLSLKLDDDNAEWTSLKRQSSTILTKDPKKRKV